MQKVVAINLNGRAYNVDEPGYLALVAYLDRAATQLANDPDRAEILRDLEQAIAEKCDRLLGPQKTVVTSDEIERIVAEMGPVQAGDDTNAPGADDAKADGSARATSSTKRLYQIREGAMISGVCVGLAEFLHVDVTIIRILFVIFALVSGGWGMLAYGVLMFLLPKVDTRAQAASGAPGTMPPHKWPWDEHGWPWDKKDRRDYRDYRRQYREHHPGATFMWIILLLVGFMWLSFWTRGGFFFGFPFFWGFPHWIGIIFFFMMLRFIFMPFRMARYGYGAYGYSHPHYAWAAMWNGLAWFMGMIFLIWVLYQFVPEFHSFIRDFQTNWRDDWHV